MCHSFFIFIVVLMEDREAEELYDWLVSGEKPARFVGRSNKNSWKSWKKKVREYQIKKKNESEEWSFENSQVLLIRGGVFKIIVRKSELEDFWKKFHESKEMGSHQGVNAMEQRMKMAYHVPKLREWLSRKVKECKICEQVRKKKVVPPRAPFLASEKEKLWMIDYIGKFTNDAETGHW